MIPATYFRSINSWFVATYKIFGFLVLGALVLGMTGFLGLNAFYLINRSWIVPAILDPHHEKVIQVNLNYLEQLQRAEKLRAERIAIESELRHIQYAVKLQEQFQKNFLLTLSKEQERRFKSLARLKKLNSGINPESSETTSIPSQLAEETKNQLEEQFKDRIIGQEELMRGQYLANQMEYSDLSQKERVVELKEKLEEAELELKAQRESREILNARAAALGVSALLDPESLAKERRNVSFESLQKEQQFLAAEITKSELLSRLAPLERQIDEMDRLLVEHETMLKSLADSPYITAAKSSVTVAFVSYDNLPQVKLGGKVIGCYLGIVFCKKAGEIDKIYSGEVIVKHPISNRDIRGVLVKIDLADNNWATERSLIVNRAPLLF